jgi:low affinity Fe/Cu permease
MWLQFFSQDIHFAINILAALATAAVCWLYFDAWRSKKAPKEFFSFTGFGILAFSFLLQATLIEQAVLGNSIFGSTTNGLAIALRILGYSLIITSQLINPLQIVPKNKGLKYELKHKNNEKKSSAIVAASSLSVLSKWLLSFGGFAVAYLYWRRATTGMERHLKRVAYAFLFLALSDLTALLHLLRNTTNPSVYDFVAPYGGAWRVEHLLLLIGTLLLGAWVWGYLTKRFFSQLFMVFINTSVIIFLLVGVAFTALMIQNVRNDSLRNLQTASKVLDYAIDSRRNASYAGAEQLAVNAVIKDAVTTKNHQKLVESTSAFLATYHHQSLLIIDQSGQVLLRAEDSDRWGDSVSSDQLVRRVLLGEDRNSTLVLEDGVGQPLLRLRSAVAMKSAQGETTGLIIISDQLDTAFVDGIKESTGLQASVYAGNTLAATTVFSSDGKTRPIGTKLENQTIKRTVLQQGVSLNGLFKLQQKQMLASFEPLKDIDGTTIGMLIISEPESHILQTASHSLQLTFYLTALFMLLLVFPAAKIAHHLSKQVV